MLFCRRSKEREMYKMIFEANLQVNKAIAERRLEMLEERESLSEESK